VELLLNLGWIVVSVAIAWFATRGGCIPGRQRATVIITIALLSALLFPAISMSDDLHVDFVLMDDVRSHRHSVAHDHVGVAVLMACAVLLDLSPHDVSPNGSTLQPFARVLSGFVRSTGLRAPPSVLA
jgi:hypothetical protein